MRAEIQELAVYIARRLNQSHWGAVFAPAAWIIAGRDRGHSIVAFFEPNGSPGLYISDEPGTGTVFFNIAYSSITQCRALVHEIAHAEIDRLTSGLHRGQIPGFVGGQYYHRGYDDDPQDAAHQVARQVELICLRSVLHQEGHYDVP